MKLLVILAVIALASSQMSYRDFMNGGPGGSHDQQDLYYQMTYDDYMNGGPGGGSHDLQDLAYQMTYRDFMNGGPGGSHDQQDLGFMSYLKAADEIYNVGKDIAPLVKEGYNDYRGSFGE